MLRISLLAAATALSACATPETGAGGAPPTGRDCFNSSAVSGYSYIDSEHVGINVGANRKYVLTTMFNARDLDWTQAIALRSSSGWICTGNGLGVEVIGGEPRRNYPITQIARAPDEAPNAEQGS
ncbi:MAG: DUF6491 family protein [Terricaulis sp.]